MTREISGIPLTKSPPIRRALLNVNIPESNVEWGRENALSGLPCRKILKTEGF